MIRLQPGGAGVDAHTRYRGRDTSTTLPDVTALTALRATPAPPGSVSLRCWITHHPSRPYLPLRLLDLLADAACFGDAQPRVVFDPKPAGPVNPWRTYRRALEEAARADGATHHLFLQDDVLPCAGLLDAAREAARWRPAALVCLFVNDLAVQTSLRIRDAAARGAGWAPIVGERFVPTVATLWPAELVARAAVEARPVLDRPQADDEAVGDWAASAGAEVWATVPNLAQHDEDAPSTFLGHRDGRARWATCWIGEHPWGAVPWSVDF